MKKYIIIFSFFVILPNCLANIVSKKDVSIEINTFDSIPSEIDGGCCVFYKNPTTEHRKGFVMVNDLASTAYMMINHKLEKFFLTTNKKDVFLYSNRNFTLKVRISSKRGKAKSEFYKVKGILVVEDHSKNKQKLPFYGNCSW